MFLYETHVRHPSCHHHLAWHNLTLIVNCDIRDDHLVRTLSMIGRLRVVKVLRLSFDRSQSILQSALQSVPFDICSLQPELCMGYVVFITFGDASGMYTQ